MTLRAALGYRPLTDRPMERRSSDSLTYADDEVPSHRRPRERGCPLAASSVPAGSAPRTPNLVLRRFREHERQETRAEFAEALRRAAESMGEGVQPSERYVARLEDGEITYPHPSYRRVLTRVCGRSMSDLGFIRRGFEDGAEPVKSESGSPVVGQVEDGNHPTRSSPRRLDAEEGERFPGVSEDAVDVLSRIQRLHRSTVHPDVLVQLRKVVRDTVTRYETLDHSELAPVLAKQRAFVETVLADCSPPRQQQGLCEINAAISGVLGYIAVGRGDFPLARAYTLEAFQLGDFAEDSNLQAWARGLQSFCEYYAGRYDTASMLAEDGLVYAKSGPQSVRLAINGVARAMGRLGDKEGVHRAVGEAYDLLSRNNAPAGVPSSITLECYSAAQTASNAATAYVSLAKADKVQHYVNLALPEIVQSDSTWSQSLVMIDLAISLIQSDTEADLERAGQLVVDALGISAGRPIISVRQRSAEFTRHAIDRWGPSSQVRAVIEASGP